MNWLGQLKCILMKTGKVHISEPLSPSLVRRSEIGRHFTFEYVTQKVQENEE